MSIAMLMAGLHGGKEAFYISTGPWVTPYLAVDCGVRRLTRCGWLIEKTGVKNLPESSVQALFLKRQFD